MTTHPEVPAPSTQPSPSPSIDVPHLNHAPVDYVDGPSSPALLGKTLEYTYTRGNTYRLIFDGEFGVSFQLLQDGDPPRGPLPYRCRELRPQQYLVHWLVRQWSIHVSLVIDLELLTINVAAVMPPGQWEFFDRATDVRVTATAPRDLTGP